MYVYIDVTFSVILVCLQCLIIMIKIIVVQSSTLSSRTFSYSNNVIENIKQK